MSANPESLRFGLKEKTIQQIHTVFSQFPKIEKATLYGSRAKGNFRQGSDIDLVLYGQQVNNATLAKIAIQLDDLLLPYSIDLSLFESIDNPELIDHIERIGIVFYRID